MTPAQRTMGRQCIAQSAPPRVGRASRPLLAALLLLLATALTTGCGPVKVRAGEPPDLPALATTLEIGKSTRNTVEATLGAPQVRGRSMLPWRSAPRTVWTYYHELGTIDLGGGESDVRRTFLFVFFDGDSYDGYMWFSSLEPFRK